VRRVSVPGGDVGLAFRSVGVDVYALNDARRATIAPAGLSRSVISARTAARALVSRPGGKCRLVCDLAADHPEGSHEGQSIGIHIGLIGGLAHEMPDRVVSEQKCPYLLLNHLR
jgi:hypothetical protein